MAISERHAKHLYKVARLLGQYCYPLRRAKTAPLGECSGAVDLEIWSGVEDALRVEIIVDRGVNGDEFLQTSHLSEAQHGTFSSSKWQARILGPVVQPTHSFLSVNIIDDLHRGAV